MNPTMSAAGRGALIAAACVLAASPSAVQGLSPAGQDRPGPSFDVASVRLHVSDDRRTMMVTQPGGRFLAVNVSARMLIRSAFQLQDDQIVGGPDWLDTDRFDVDARATGVAGAPGVELLGMLQSLLIDRFTLMTHRETREVAVFALERARADGELGPAMRPTACPDIAVNLAQGQTVHQHLHRRGGAADSRHSPRNLRAVPRAERQPCRGQPHGTGWPVRRRAHMGA